MNTLPVKGSGDGRHGGGTPPPEPRYDLTYASAGFGKQSSALMICSALGLHGVPKADCAIFADTGDEIKDTYEHADRMEVWLRERGIPLYRVRIPGTTLAAAAAAISGRRRENGNRFFVSLPIYTKGAWKCIQCAPHLATSLRLRTLDECGFCKSENIEGRWDSEHIGIARRQCTNEFKLVPIRKKVRELLGLEPGERANGKLARAMLGISIDEAAMRMKPSKDSYIENIYPLVDARLSVESCARIVKDHFGYVPVKSACKMCPYHDNNYWRWLKNERPEEFEEACKFDELIRDLSKAGLEGAGYLHRTCRPLREINFSLDVDRGQLLLAGGFGNECEAYCGV